MKNKLEEIFNINKKCVMITGASGFFGRYMAETFLELGSKVILLGHSARLIAQTKEYCRKFGKDKAHSYRVDFYKRENLKNILKKITDTFEIDVLINNAYDLSPKTGFNTPTGHLEKSTYGQWSAAFESGIYWAVLTTQIVGGQFRLKGKGSIINISSMYGEVAPNPRLYKGTKYFNPPTYSVNKAGLIALTRYTASFWGPEGVRCNAILPGAFSNTESKTANSVKPGDNFLERLRQNTALRRIGHPNDLRGILVYLASDASSYMTGQAIKIDGGWTIT